MPPSKSSTASPSNDESEKGRRTPSPDELAQASSLIQRAVTRTGSASLRNIKPLAVSATLDPRFDPNDPQTLLDHSVEVGLIVNPLFNAVMLGLGYDRLGERSYAIGAGKKTPAKIITATLEVIPGAMARSGKAAERAHSNGIENGHSHYYKISNELSGCPAGSGFSTSDVMNALFNAPSATGHSYGTFHQMREDYRHNFRAKATAERYREHSMVALSTNGTQLMIKVCSAWSAWRKNEAKAQDRDHRGLVFWPGAPDLHHFKVKGTRDSIYTTPAEAVALLECARAWGLPVHDGGEIAALRERVHSVALVERVPGSPGRARLMIGRDGIAAASGISDLMPLGDSQISVREGSAAEIDAVAEQLRTSGQIEVVADRSVSDVIRMSKAVPTGERDPLRPYQDEAVSLHLATEIGYVNASSPGLGKTVMALFACKEKAQEQKGYRALVTAPASIRSQWMRESARFFPQARVATFTAAELKDGLDDFLAATGDRPAVIILSYEAMRGGVEKLSEISWDDLFCDEAAIIGSTASARTKALWKLRRSAKVAVAMTGTPINKSLDDLGRILAWARGDETAFHGQRLSQRFDMSSDDDVTALWDALGTTVFRRDRSEIADQLPVIDTEVITLDPQPAELALANGARDELRKIYETLMQKLAVARELNPNDPKLAQAQEDMKRVRGAVLGGITLARMAASDPASVKESKSAGVALLEAARLVDPAVKCGGTKRKMIADLTDDLVQRGDAVLIFTEFYSVARDMAADLEARGLRVGTFTGKNAGAKRDKAAEDFQKGNLDVLVLTGAGREGLNLQRASVLVQLDLPWVPSAVVQRIGRASRFGSTADRLQVLIPIMAGTIEERVAALLVPRAVEALRALDTHRGVDAAETEVGLAMKGLEAAVPDGVKAEQQSVFALAGSLFGD